jgi:hypothetical protein
MTEELYPDLGYLLKGYFHQNWAAISDPTGNPPSYRRVAAKFRAVETHVKVARVVADLNQVIAESLTEPELRALTLRLGSQFYPPGAGVSYQAWLTDLRDILAAADG